MKLCRKIQYVFIYIIMLSIVYTNIVTAMSSSEIQEIIKKEFAMNDSMVIKLQEPLGENFTDIRIDTVNDYGVLLSLLQPGNGWKNVLVGFDGRIYKPSALLHNEIAIVSCGEKYGLIDKNYHWKIPPICEVVYSDMWGLDTILMNEVVIARICNKSVIINKNGEIAHVVPDGYIPLIADAKTAICYSEKNAYIWRDNKIIQLDLPTNSEKIYFEECYNRNNSNFIVGIEKNIDESNIIYHVFDQNGNLSYSLDSNKVIGKADELSSYTLLNNGKLYIHVPGCRPVVCDESGILIDTNDDFRDINQIYSCFYGDYIWNFETCYDEKLFPIFEWGFDSRDYPQNQMIVGSGKNYIVFLPANCEKKSVYEVEGYCITPTNEMVVAFNDEANPMKSPSLADEEKISLLLECASEDIHVYLNEKELEFDTQPIMVDDRVLVPMRKIFEQIGAEINWDDGLQCAVARKNNIEVSFYIGEKYIIKNGEQIPIDVPVQLINDRTLVPLRAISEAFDLKVEWIDALRTVSIVDI